MRSEQLTLKALIVKFISGLKYSWGKSRSNTFCGKFNISSDIFMIILCSDSWYQGWPTFLQHWPDKFDVVEPWGIWRSEKRMRLHISHVVLHISRVVTRMVIEHNDYFRRCMRNFRNSLARNLRTPSLLLSFRRMKSILPPIEIEQDITTLY